MRVELVVAMVSVAIVIGVLVLHGLVPRNRLLPRLERAEAGVAEAKADGRLSAVTGEALLQHLEGLRKACVRGEEG